MSLSFGSSKKKGSSSQTTNPWEPTIPGLESLISSITGFSKTGVGPTSDQLDAFEQLKANAGKGDPNSENIGQLSADLFGAGSRSGDVTDAYNELAGRLGDTADGKNLNVEENPYLQGMMQTVGDNIFNKINATFAGAGRDITGNAAGLEAVGKGITEGQLPALFNQYNLENQNRMNAANQLFGAKTGAASTAQGLDQASLGTRMQGIDVGKAFLDSQNQGANTILNLEEQMKDMPAEDLANFVTLARRARGRRRRPHPGRLAHRGGAGREAAPRVRSCADGPGEPHRRGAGRQSAPRGSRRRTAGGPSGPPRAALPGHAPARAFMSTTANALGRVLVVDDELGPRESLRMLLKPSYAIQTAENGRTALDLLRRFQPDIVIMDIKMPEMDGLELLRHVKRADPSIEVVMITAYASLETVRHALTHGAFEYLIKPFSRQDLEDVVHRALVRRQADLGTRGQVARLVEEMRKLSAKTRELEEAEATEQSLRVTQLSILREISRTIVGHLDPQNVTAAVTDQLRAALGYDGVEIVPEMPVGIDKNDPFVVACVIRDMQGPLGHLVVDNRSTRRAIDPRERELLEMLSEYLAIALRNSRLYGEIADTKQRLEQTISSAGDAIISVSPDDRVEKWNPAAERIFGYSAAQAIGRPITDMLPRGDYA